MKKLVLLVTFLAVALAGCIQQEIKENQVYVVSSDNSSEEQLDGELNIEGRIPFQKYVSHSPVVVDEPRQIVLTFSPDGEEMYLMERMETSSFSQVIMGETAERVRIIKVDVESENQEIVVENIPFVSRVLWNSEGNMVAFGGGGRLTIYDVVNKNTLMEEKLRQDTITYFFWSPNDENKLYSEQPNLANGSIYYLSSQKKVEAYETREETYYKGKLESNYYYGTKWDLVNDDIYTVIVDKQGKIIKDLAPGRFRDAFQRSLVVIGESGFGLHYIKDINNSQEVITLTEDYVYDVKFTADGSIAYTTKSREVETNSFYLHIANSEGRELERFKVLGGNIFVSPDGRAGYISGPVWQRVDFIENKLAETTLDKYEEEHEDVENIFTTIRGAMTILYDYELKGQLNRNKVEEYFVNSSSPDQWARFDVETIFKEEANWTLRGGHARAYTMQIYLKNFDISSTAGIASATVGVEAETISGRGFNMDYALELLKSEGRWYVTGFSTFSYSEEHKKVKEIAEELVSEMQQGEIFSGKLEEREITIGQIQFWRSGMPHLSPSVESANSVKVFLKVGGQGEVEIYKLVLDKLDQNYWEPIKLTNESLSII